MSVCRVQVQIPYYTAIPADVITNTFHFRSVPDNPTSTDAEEIVDQLEICYEALYDSSLRAAPYINGSAVRVKVYDLSDPEPRVPILNESVAWTFAEITSTAIPPETAVCLSYHGDFTSGISNARRRGRIYFGAISEDWILTGSGSSFPRLGTGATTDLATFGTTLEAGAAMPNWEWVAYSSVSGLDTPVTGGWVDNAIDTQRRRGFAPSLRTTW